MEYPIEVQDVSLHSRLFSSFCWSWLLVLFEFIAGVVVAVKESLMCDLELPHSDQFQCEYDFDAFLCVHRAVGGDRPSSKAGQSSSDDWRGLSSRKWPHWCHPRQHRQESGHCLCVVAFVHAWRMVPWGCAESLLSSTSRCIGSVILDDEVLKDFENESLVMHMLSTNSPLRLSDYESQEIFYEDLATLIGQSSITQSINIRLFDDMTS